ncbi:hypothetical protein ABCR94_34570 [Streptomyces sp. 21So2-11]|uniref:hypothetical protein n=1 Tax=Streptomyces sp. 21So2-11 TaxID=3144408 RepID=UPI003219AF4E
MDAADDGAPVVFARLAGAYWLDRESDDCPWCRALLAAGDQEAAVPAGNAVRAARDAVSAFSQRARAVMLPVAVTTVVSALLAVVLA